MSKAKILIIHRQYRNLGGEDLFVEDILIPALKISELEWECLTLRPLNLALDILEIFGMITGLEGLRPSLSRCLSKIEEGGFTHILFNNCLPTISLKLPFEIKKRNLKTLAWIHNFRVDCANGLHFNGKNICKRCLDKGSRWSLIQNCQKNWLQSLVYALAYRGQRIARHFIPFIDQFICNSEFTKSNLNETLKKLNLNGSSTFISMPVPLGTSFGEPKNILKLTKNLPNPFYLFLGRLSYEKGADLFLELAKKYPTRGFLMAGDGPMLEELRKTGPPNLAFSGRVGADEKPWLFKNCEALIVPSRTPETSSLVISESHPYGTPVVYPRGGGAAETFKLLERIGCPLDEFNGQTFTHSDQNIKGPSLGDFVSSLKNIVMEMG